MTLARPDVTHGLDPETMVDALMRRWPNTVKVFIHWRMKCIGCPFGIFHSIERACEEHGVERGTFVEALENAMPAGTLLPLGEGQG